ncbi:LAME_0H03840g1_1 [Lachancea meyersii CBS 8951]|uniref:LAME_0H03840g1_1 n=1 Tax=Lachancea meyersii CBS 8951 TaxID=1266667 RepID=A0A1G4KDS0_9SACH|nr:LAME_0H03840g1_1 [Lachancea meyersii CBS 8951]
MQDILVPSGQDECVRLTLVSTFQDIQKVCKYLGYIQDTFSVELESCETITQNLKVSCLSHGTCTNCPLYILEYDLNSHNYALWKSSSGEWALGTTLARFFAPHPTSKARAKLGIAKLQSYLDTSQLSTKHDRQFLVQTLQKLNVDWHSMPFDFNFFQDALDRSVQSETHDNQQTPNNYPELVSPLQYKSLISMAVLKTKVHVNKKRLEADLHAYDSRIRVSRDHMEPGADTEVGAEQQDVSRENSVFSNTPEDSTSPIDDEYALSSRQLKTNFKKHFKGMAESFETFDVQQSAPRAIRNWKVGKPVKNGKTRSKRLKA